MNPRTYDFGLAAGLVSCTAGAGLLAGLGVALLVFGGLSIVLTMASAFLTLRVTRNR